MDCANANVASAIEERNAAQALVKQLKLASASSIGGTAATGWPQSSIEGCSSSEQSFKRWNQLPDWGYQGCSRRLYRPKSPVLRKGIVSQAPGCCVETRSTAILSVHKGPPHDADLGVAVVQGMLAGG